MRIKVLLLKHFISNRFVRAGDQITRNVWCFSRKPSEEEEEEEEDCSADIVQNELSSSALTLTTEGSRYTNYMLMRDLVALTCTKVESGGDAGGSRGPPGSPTAIN